MSTQPASYYLKTSRAFSPVRKYAWLLTVLIGIGGQFFPLLGLLVPLIMAALLVTSLFKGKYWCGNYCPHGSFFDNLLQPLSRHLKVPPLFRSKAFIVFVLLFFIFNLTLRFINVYGAMGTGEFYEKLGLIFASTYLVVLLAGGLLAVIIDARTWCHFCPMGTMQTLMYKLGKALGLTNKTDEKVTLEQPELCRSCGKCARVCPMQLAPHQNFSENHQFDDEQCIRCHTCIKNCPVATLSLANLGKDALKEGEHTSHER